MLSFMARQFGSGWWNKCTFMKTAALIIGKKFYSLSLRA